MNHSLDFLLFPKRQQISSELRVYGANYHTLLSPCVYDGVISVLFFLGVLTVLSILLYVIFFQV